MYPHLTHVFLDGGYLRGIAKEFGKDLVNPRNLAKILAESGQVQTWAYNPSEHPNALLARIGYYDALPDDAQKQPADLEDYWKAVELLDDVYVGFGALRGLTKKLRQKGVDTLIAVDMLVGAFSHLFDIAILAAGDADFVPVVEEVKKRGVMVTLAGTGSTVSQDLRRSADRYIEIMNDSQWFEPMRLEGRTWKP